MGRRIGALVNGNRGPAVAVPGLGALSPEGVEVATSISCTGPDAPDTESVYADSCAAPRDCGAGGILGGGMGRPYAVVANETPE